MNPPARGFRSGRFTPPADHFHVRGADATAELAKLAGVQAGWTVLDAGSGLGGPSRPLAERYGCHVEGVDLRRPATSARSERSSATSTKAGVGRPRDRARAI